MSYPEQPGPPYPPRDPREMQESQYPPPPGEYPPPPGEEDERARAYHQRGPPPTLPSISPYDPQYAAPIGYPSHSGRPEQPYPPQPHGGYYPGPDYGRGAPQQMTYTQSAPRQRTAIACRYCRRRKIRCSGFEDNPLGKCSNCARFQQECIFTPVSSQAQAFVPAHAAYPHMRNVALGPDGRPRMMYPQGQQLYGAHGQPLGPMPPQQAPSPYAPEYSAPSPTGSYGSYTDDRAESSRKRGQPEPHPSILPPPVPGQPGYAPQQSRRAPVEEDLRLPPVTPTVGNSNYSPGSSTSSNSGRRPDGLPAMSRTPPPRSSPGDRADPMSLGNIMERHPETRETEIDRNMLGRLGRK